MNSQRAGLRIASVIFGLLGLIHIYRALIGHFTVQIGSHVIPLGASWIFAIIGVVLCIWMWKLSSAR
jgi:hypothetical protein